ncbi:MULTISPECIES: LysR family transcriptional regulator [Streptomyces]|uniref:LysR family transcriptional regulator n=1 Tax=Streptomyces tricolor TaxID=68277 RepID=A0ABS9J8A5_9ACTN|nr:MULTISPECIES: LysR family transcriptional regulator [Streptomyces]MCG0061799.1 LysR family transcriptional regulator [Streptomyces tricolor]MYU30764.1 LysR family transcriptional regulator [Streptomyces sp. SID7810]OYP20027.1 LysR family transcriptional regulator [Streptomyces sp. FBKL.4005]
MELRQLRTFEAVVRHRTVTDAAAALDRAPSSVSQQIRALEDALAVPLFVRGPKGMELTPAGERLRGWARTLLDIAEQAALDVRDQRRRLRLGALETLAGSHVPLVLTRLAERRPDIDVDVHSDRARQGLLTDVVAGRLDAALLLDAGEDLGGLGFPAPPEPLGFVDLDPVPLALVAAPTHPLAGRTALVPADLDHERLLVNVPECSFWMAGERILGAGPVRIRAGGVPVMRAWAEHGLGISLLPRFAVADSLRAGTLVRLDLALPDLSLRLVWREDRETLPGLRDILYAAARP